MILLWILRILLYIQLVLGLARFSGLLVNQRIWESHITLGVVIAVLALVALRPLAGVPSTGVRVLARFAPLVPLALGLGFLFNLIGGLPLVVLHMALGIGTIGLVEAAAAQQRRAQQSGT